jgi:hypothetical protein
MMEVPEDNTYFVHFFYMYDVKKWVVLNTYLAL